MFRLGHPWNWCDHYSGYVITEDLDADFDRRWTAWKMRGLVHERLVRQRFVTTIGVAAVIAFGAFLAYGFIV